MSITENAKKYHEKTLPNKTSDLARTDPELIELFDNFAFDDVVNQDDLDDHTRMIAILAMSAFYRLSTKPKRTCLCEQGIGQYGGVKL